jgi:hypothetical protein
MPAKVAAAIPPQKMASTVRAVAPSAQRRSAGASAHVAPQLLDNPVNSARVKKLLPRKPDHHGLPPGLRAGIEALSGFSMDQVQVHYNSGAPAQLRAFAYAQGQDIHLGPGQESQLPHEAWHVVQQAQGRVRPTLQRKRGLPVNDDRALEAEADRMGAQALALPAAVELAAARPLKSIASNAGNRAPLQGRFGFEIELPILFLSKRDREIKEKKGAVTTDTTVLKVKDVPCDPSIDGSPVNLHAVPELGLHVNVDHSLALNGLFSAELEHYCSEKKLDKKEKAILLAAKDQLMPSRASIVEVVTDPWDESAMTRLQALDRIGATIAWIENLFQQIEGNRQAPLGNYFIGSNTPHSTLFQPRLGYFHATYGVKLSQVPNLFARTTVQKDSLRDYALTNKPQAEHANNVMQTYLSIEKAREVLAHIKSIWPLTKAGPSESSPLGWEAGSEEVFLGFLNLLTNYFLMFKANNQDGTFLKQAVGMHFYKTDLAELAVYLPTEIRNKLRSDPILLRETATALAAAVDMKPNAQFDGVIEHKPSGSIASAGKEMSPTLEEYLRQLIFANQSLMRKTTRFKDVVLYNGLNQYSGPLGPDILGQPGHRDIGIVMENRHLEYLDPNYGVNQTVAELKRKEEFAKLGALPEAKRSALERAQFASIGAREEGAAIRPMAEWRGIMIGIYDMINGING